jgi:hypothetical protein
VGFQFVLVFTKKRVSYKTQCIASLIISCFSLGMLPVAMLTMGHLAAFVVCAIVVTIQGFANAVVLSCLFGIISYLPFKYIIAMSWGQGAGAVFLNIIQYILLASLGDPENEKNINLNAIIFYAISCAITLYTLFTLLTVYKMDYFIYSLKQSGEFPFERYGTLLALQEVTEEITKVNNIF